MQLRSFILALTVLLFLSGCTSEPRVQKQYFTGGELRQEFIMSDDSGQNGILKKYGYDGKITSIVTIQNGVRNGMEVWYDPHNRPIRQVPYVSGHIHGTRIDTYPNGKPLGTIPYVRGIPNGEAYSYKKDGSIHRTVIYNDGKIVN
ncbi:MAG: hypothetical protein Q9M36_05875 [Sulfurovum sp.]|nr:hypothetical protein [Sulfurovum sp.]